MGAAVAVALGVYGRVHSPSQHLVFTLGLSSTIAMKVWLATVVLAFTVVQVLTALWLYGKLPWRAPAWLDSIHRLSGRAAFLISLPVAYHCLWSLGFQATHARVLIHSVLGCLFYDAFCGQGDDRPFEAPAVMVTAGRWWSHLYGAGPSPVLSGLWFVQNQGFPSL